MGPILFKAAAEDGREFIILAWVSDNEPITEGCDACIGYALFGAGPDDFIDGGEMDCRGGDYPDVTAAASDLAAYVSADIGSRMLYAKPIDEDPLPYEEAI